MELEKALAGWLRKQISQIEEGRQANPPSVALQMELAPRPSLRRAALGAVWKKIKFVHCMYCQYREPLWADSLTSSKRVRLATAISEMQMKVLLMMACMLLAWGLFADDCVKNARGKTVCSNGQTAAAVNPNTGKAATAQKNQNGVTTTQTSSGRKAKTKNGKGVAQGPNGTTCAKGANQQGCTK